MIAMAIGAEKIVNSIGIRPCTVEMAVSMV